MNLPANGHSNGVVQALLANARAPAVTAPTIFGPTTSTHEASRRPEYLTLAQLDQRNCRRNWLVNGVLVQGEPAFIGGPSKSMKTSVAIDMAISIGSGGRFLGRYPAARGSVLYISAESGEATIQSTCRRICTSKGVLMANVNMMIRFGTPQLSNPEHLAELTRHLQESPADVVVIDPLYLTLLGGQSEVSAANMYQMGPLLSRVTETCTLQGATPIFIHHFHKAATYQYGEPSLEDLAFAGCGQFARQWLLIKRSQPFDPETGHSRLAMVAGGSAGHSLSAVVDITEGRMTDDFSGRRWNVTVQTAMEARVTEQAERQQQRVVASATRDSSDETVVVAYLSQHPEGESFRGLGEETTISHARAKAAVLRLVARGSAEHFVGRKGRNSCVDLYRLTLATSPADPTAP